MVAMLIVGGIRFEAETKSVESQDANDKNDKRPEKTTTYSCAIRRDVLLAYLFLSRSILILPRYSSIDISFNSSFNELQEALAFLHST